MVSEYVNIIMYICMYLYISYVYEKTFLNPAEKYLTGLLDKSLLLGTAGGMQGDGNESLKLNFKIKKTGFRNAWNDPLSTKVVLYI